MTTKATAQRTESDGKATASGSAPAASAANKRRLEPLVGNFAMQRFVQAQLRVGHPDDPQELEADHVASLFGSGSCGGCSAGAPCAACSEKRIRRKPSASCASRTPSVPAAQLARLGAGSALDSPTQTRMQQHFGRDFARVRVHSGSDAATAAQGIQARAFTSGHDIVFDRGEYRPGTNDGERLIAHELTHVVQNDGDQSPIRRVVNGDIRTMSIADGWARNLTDPELNEQTDIVRGEIARHAQGTPERQTASDNLAVLQAEFRRRNPDAPAPGQLVPRPPGLPLGSGYQLTPIQLPSNVASQIPDGELVTLAPAGPAAGSPAAGTGTAGTGPLSYIGNRPSTGVAGVAGGTWSGLRVNLSRYGFAAAGDDAIGIVAFPRYAPGRALSGMSSFLPEHPVLWGHTAVYSRVGGRIVAVRSYAPASLLRAGVTPAVEAGTQGVPAAIYNESGVVDIFNVSNARSIEWAVPPEQAAAFAEGLPEGATYGFADALEGAAYTARPLVTGCEGTNCIGWALPEIEGEIGTIASAQTPGVSVGPQGQFLQGKLIRFIQSAEENPESVAVLRGAQGELPMAAGSLSRGMQVLKWGGRVMLVVGIVLIPVEIALARPEERVRTGVSATAGFLGGLGAGALAGLACGPGAPVCSVILGIGFGIAGAYAARSTAEALYDASTAPTPAAVYRPPCPGQTNCHAANPPQDPWRLSTLSRPSAFGGPPSPLAHTPRTRSLSDTDFAVIEAWLRSQQSQSPNQSVSR